MFRESISVTIDLSMKIWKRSRYRLENKIWISTKEKIWGIKY